MKCMAAAFRGALLCSLCVPSLAFLVDSVMQPRNCLVLSQILRTMPRQKIGEGKKEGGSGKRALQRM